MSSESTGNSISIHLWLLEIDRGEGPDYEKIRITHDQS